MGTMQEEIDALLAAAKRASIAAHKAGYQIDYVSFQYSGDEIEVGVRVSQEALIKIEPDPV